MDLPYLPTKVYKYMRKKWIVELEKKQSIFINHLNNYPETVHGSEIGDDFEGKSQTEIDIDNYTIAAGKQTKKEREILSSHGISNDGTGTISFENVKLIKDHVDNNYFVYCVSLEKKKSIQRAFGSGLQTIFNFPEFVKHLNAELAKKGIEFHDAGECIYLPKRAHKYRLQDLTQGEREILIQKPYFVKEERYNYQREFRLIWKPSGNKTIEKPILLENFRAASFHYSTTILEPANQKKKKKKKKSK